MFWFYWFFDIFTIVNCTPALAEKSSGSNGLEKVDDNIHENAPDNDVTFHEGLCQGGHSTEALDNLGGCNILSDQAKVTIIGIMISSQ